jgi:histone deacetylase 6
VARTLVGQPPPPIDIQPPQKHVRNTILEVALYQSKYWMSVGGPIVEDIKLKQPTMPEDAERLHDTLRYNQQAKLFEQFRMTKLSIQWEHDSPTYKNLVLATPQHWTAKTLMLIVHDPPEVHAVHDPWTRSLEAHNTYITDNITKYIKWAVERKFGVMDVNIPKYLTEWDDEGKLVFTRPLEEDDKRRNNCYRIVRYVWENYLTIADATNIVFVGVGDAYLGLADLMKGIGSDEDHKDRVLGIVNFIGMGPVATVKSDDGTGTLEQFYHSVSLSSTVVKLPIQVELMPMCQKSLNFVSAEHGNYAAGGRWDKKRPAKRNGRIHQSERVNIQEELAFHFDDATEWIAERLAEREDGDTSEMVDE